MKTVMNVLNCVCVKCGTLRFDISDPDVAETIRVSTGNKRLMELASIGKSWKKCGADKKGKEVKTAEGDKPLRGCGYPQPSYTRRNFRITAKNKEKQVGSPRELSMIETFFYSRYFLRVCLHIMFVGGS